MSQNEPEPRRLRDRNEKDEKDSRDEKEEKDEKGRGEKWQSDPLSGLIWAALFVWAGLVLLADNLGILGDPRIGDYVLKPWNIILIGASLILVIEVLIRLVDPAYRRSVTGTLIFAGILLGIALGDVIGWGVIWAIILIAIGVSIILGNLTKR